MAVLGQIADQNISANHNVCGAYNLGTMGAALALTSTRTISPTFANADDLKTVVIWLKASVSNITKSVTLNLKESGVSRKTVTLTAAQIVSGLSDTSGDGWCVPFEAFNYTISTAAATWTIDITQGAGTGDWSVRTSNGTAISYACINSTTAAPADGDTFIFSKRVTWDASRRLGAVTSTGDTTNGICGWICKKVDTVTATNGAISLNSDNEYFYVPSTMTSQVVCTLDGLLLMGAHSGMRRGTHVQFTGSLSAGATSATLTANWGGATGTYQMTFHNSTQEGSAVNGLFNTFERKMVTLTNGATTCTWTGGLTGACAAYGDVGVPSLLSGSNNIPGFKLVYNVRTVGTTATGIYGPNGTTNALEKKASSLAYGQIPTYERVELLADTTVNGTTCTTSTNLTTGDVPWAINDIVWIGKQDVIGIGDTNYYTISNIAWDGTKTTITLSAGLASYVHKASTATQPNYIVRVNGYGLQEVAQTPGTALGIIYLKHLSNWHWEGIQFTDISTNHFYTVGYHANETAAYRSMYYIGRCSASFTVAANYWITGIQVQDDNMVMEYNNARRCPLFVNVFSSVVDYTNRNFFKSQYCLNADHGFTTNGYPDYNIGNLYHGNNTFAGYVGEENTDCRYWGLQYATYAPNTINRHWTNCNFDKCATAIMPYQAFFVLARGSGNKYGTEAAISIGEYGMFYANPVDFKDENPTFRSSQAGEPIPQATTDIQTGSRIFLKNVNTVSGQDRTIYRQGKVTQVCGTATMTIASPAVVTHTNHGLVAGDEIMFTSTASLPTGVSQWTSYYVIATDLTANTFKFSATVGGSAINTSGSQSGTHYLIAVNKATVSNTMAGETLSLPYKITTGTIANNKVYIAANAKIIAAAYYAGTYTAPTLTITHNSSTQDTATAAANTNLQTLETIFTPSVDNKDITATFSQYSDATEANTKVRYDSFEVNVRRYGKTFQSYSKALNTTLDPLETYVAIADESANPYITEATAATVAAYTEFTVNHATQTVTITADTTLARLYDYSQYDLTLDANMGYAEWLTTLDGENFTSTYNITLNTGVDLTGGGSIDVGSQTFTRTGTATYDGVVITDTNRTVHVKLNGLVAGSVVQIYNTSDSSEIDKDTVSGTTYDLYYTYTADKNIRVRVRYVNGTTGYLPFEATGTISSTGFELNVSQESATVYNANNFDGSTATEFAMTEGVIRIDVDDADNTTTFQRLYNWYLYKISTETHIDDQPDYITANSTRDYVFDDTLAIKNLDLSNPVYISGANVRNESNDNALLDTSGGMIFIRGDYPAVSAAEIWADDSTYGSGTKGKNLKDAAKAKLLL